MQNNIIELDEEIGPKGIDSKDFINSWKEVSTLKPNVIILRINSPGGSVFDGIAMCNTIESSAIPFDAYIVGIACSMASVIPMYCRKVYMAENALMMIHNPSVGSGGESKHLRRDADLLDKMKSSMVAKYVSKTGLSKSKIVAMMDEETWMTAQEAKELGFVDELIKPVKNIPVSLRAVAKAKPDYETTLKLFSNKKPQNMDLHTELPKVLGLKKPTDEQVVNEIKRLKTIETEASRVIPGTVDNLISTAVAEAIVSDAEILELTAMGNGSLEVLNRYLNKLRDSKIKENESKVESLFSKYSNRITMVNLDARASLRTLGLSNPGLLENVLSAMPVYKSLGDMIENVKFNPTNRATWTLDDYRKHAPGELESNPELYKSLCEKEFTPKPKL